MHLCNYSMNNQRVRVGLVGCGREGGGRVIVDGYF